MRKIATILFCFLFWIIGLTAGDHTLRNFDVQKGKKEYFIVKPKNYESLLKSLKIDTLVYIGQKYYENADDMIAKGYQYEHWEKKMVQRTVPDETYGVIQQLMNKDTLHKNVRYNILHLDVLIDREGNYLSVSFRISDNLIKALTDVQLQQISDAFMKAKKVEAEIMEILNMREYYTKEQNNEMWEYMSGHANELTQKGAFTPLKVFEKLSIKPIQLDYALLEIKVGDIGEVYKYRENMNTTNHN